MSKAPRRIDGLIVSALQRVDTQGLTLPELVAALPGENRNSIGVALSRLRVAGQVITLRQHPVAINWWAGVPLTIVQQILGHANLNTTAIYLQFSGQEAKAILKDRGLI